MARAHFRYTATDQAGNRIQNALVYLFATGNTNTSVTPPTGTAISGSIFNAYSGGSTTTSPLTTNSQGEVECWFATGQAIDVVVTDNSDTAYRAVYSAETLAFSHQKEFVPVVQDPSDIQTAIDHVTDASAAHAATAVSVAPFSTIAATTVQAALEEIVSEATSGAPTNADYLVGTANGSLSNEIVAGTTPGGELGGTWGSPTVDATHSGSTHAATQAAAEATASAALTTHANAADPHAVYRLESAAIDTADLANDAVTYAKIQNVTATDRLLGRDTASAGDVEELTVGGGVEFTGSGGIQRSALTGEVTASAGSNSTTVASSHGGGTHAATQAAAEATAASALSTHESDTSTHGIADTSLLVLEVKLAEFFVTGNVSVTTGNNRVYVKGNHTITAVRASVGTAPTGASLIVDVNLNGTTVFGTQSNRPTIAISGFTDLADAINTTTVTDGDYFTADIDQIGSTIAGAGLVVQVWGTRR